MKSITVSSLVFALMLSSSAARAQQVGGGEVGPGPKITDWPRTQQMLGEMISGAGNFVTAVSLIEVTRPLNRSAYFSVAGKKYTAELDRFSLYHFMGDQEVKTTLIADSQLRLAKRAQVMQDLAERGPSASRLRKLKFAKGAIYALTANSMLSVIQLAMDADDEDKISNNVGLAGTMFAPLGIARRIEATVVDKAAAKAQANLETRQPAAAAVKGAK